MNKKSLIKISAAGIMLLLSLTLLLFLLMPFISNAFQLEEKYTIGEDIKINLEEYSNYTLKIITPSNTLLKQGNEKSILFSPKEIGNYSVIIISEDKSESLGFEVIEPGNLSNGNFSNAANDSDENKSNENASSIVEKTRLNGSSTEDSLNKQEGVETQEMEVSRTRKKIKVISTQKHYIDNPPNKATTEGGFSIYPTPTKSNTIKEIGYNKSRAYSKISEELEVLRKSQVRLYSFEEEKYVEFNPEDKNNNGIIDGIAWSINEGNLNYEIIIITKAVHLDAGKNFISDIYDSVKALDNIWSEVINENEYIRVSFEKNLTNNNDITIYPKIISGSPAVEIYITETNNKIAEFYPLISSKLNKVYLTKLQGSSDTFDLKLINGSVSFDYIFDPISLLRPNADGTYTAWSVTGAANDFSATSDNSAVSYISESTDEDRDTMNIQDLPSNAVSVNNITIIATCRAISGGGGAERIETAIYEGGTYTGGANQDVSRTAYTNYSESYTANPRTSNPWLISEVNSMEAGIRLKAIGSGESVRCTEVYVNADYVTDTTNPGINITYPLNTSYSINVSTLNYTYSDSNPGYCWYSNSSGIWNSSSASAGTNFTNVITNQGSNTLTLYCNDSVGNTNSSTITFFRTVPSLSLNITSPLSQAYNLSSINFNVSLSSDTNWCIFSLNNNPNITMAQFNSTYFYYEKKSIREGANNLTIVCNSTYGIFNSTNLNFSVSEFDLTSNISRNSVTITGTSSTVYRNITDPSKAFLLFSSRTNNDAPNENQVTGELQKDRIIFTKYASAANSIVEWEVIESPNLYVQRGEIAYNSSDANKNIVLEESVNTSRSFLIITNRLNSGTAAANAFGFWLGDLVNSTYLNFTRGMTGAEGNLSWQVIEWKDAVVKNGSASTTSASVTSSISSAVNLSKSFLVFSRKISGTASDDDMVNTIIAGYFTNSTNLRFFRRAAGGTASIDWFVVESSEFSVQSGFTYLNNNSIINISINPINMSQSFSLTSWDASGTGTSYARMQQTHKIADVSILQFQKANTNNNQNNSWFVISLVSSVLPDLINSTSPSNNSYYKDSSLNFSVSLVRAGSWCGFLLDNATSNVTMTQFNTTYFNYAKTGLAEGNHNITFYCNDTSNILNSSGLLFFTIDQTKPKVTLISPQDNTLNTTANSIKLYYNVTDVSPISNCSLIINGSLVATDLVITRNISQYLDAYFPNGNYTWSINCTDSAGNENISETRKINTSVSTPFNWKNRWWETFNQDFSGETAEIDLYNPADSTGNKINMNLSSDYLTNIIIANSPYLGNKGAKIPAATTVTFNAYANVSLANVAYITWSVYASNYTTDILICQSGDNSTGGAIMDQTSAKVYSSTCATTSDIILKDSDRVKLVINVFNNASSSINLNHFWDSGQLSFVDFSTFTLLGNLYSYITYPSNDQSIAIMQNLNVTCTANCSIGECQNTNIYLQYNTTSNNWINVGSSGNIVLAAGEINPHSLGTVTNSSVTTNFSISGNNISTNNNLRCIGISDYSSYNGTITLGINISSGLNSPSLNLTSPVNGTWFNSPNLTLSYNISDSDNNIANCSLYIDGTYNQSNSTAVINNQINNFTFNSSDKLYNWTVLCFDNTALNGTDTARYFYIDTVKPLITQISPQKNQSMPSSNVLFNFTAIDNLAGNMSCNLTIDSSIRESNINFSNGSYYNNTYSLGLGTHLWNVTCMDNAGNTNTSETWNFSISDTPPTVNLTSPINETWFNSSSVILYYNVSDNNYPANCSLYINGIFNQTNSTALLNSQINNFTFSSADNLYNWTVLCYDSTNYNGTDIARHFYIDTTKPAINLNLPGNNTSSNSSNINFNFTVTDNLDSSLICNLTINSIIADINFTANNSSLTNRPIYNLTDDAKYWNVTCMDNANNTNSSATWIVNITEYPRINLNTPNNSWFNGTVILNYTPMDNTNFSNCSLYINGAFNQSNSTSIINNQINNFTLLSLPNGIFNWSINCSDTFGLKNVSETRVFYKDNIKPTINLSHPPDDGQIYTSPVAFNFTVTDNLDSNLSCNLTVDGNNSDANFNASNGTMITRYLSLNADVHLWNVTCWDDAENINISITRNFTNYASPTVILNSPSLGEWLNTTANNLQYTPSDADDNIANCSLYINGIFNKSNSSEIILDDINTFAINLSDNYYNWSIECWDLTNLNGSAISNFSIDTQPPQLNIYNPIENQTVTWNNITFNFSVIDNMAQGTICNGYIKIQSEPSYSSLFSNVLAQNNSYVIRYSVKSDENYSWYAECSDNATNTNISQVINFTLEAPPNVTLISPDGTRNNSMTTTFTYTPSDPITLYNCSLYIDEAFNQTDPEVDNNQQNIFTVSGIQEGTRNWTIQCIDSDLNVYAPSAKYFTIDRSPPSITLETPVNDSGIDMNTGSVTFRWTATDLLDSTLRCNLTIDNINNKTNILITSSISHAEPPISGFSIGAHTWNVTCWDHDITSNKNTSQTRIFNYTYPDFSINSSDISINSTNIKESDWVNITSIIYNLGGADTSSVIAKFYNGDPDSGGTQIGANQIISFKKYTSNTTSVQTNTSIGLNNIFVVVDPPTSTNGSFKEWNESNNKANTTISIQSWSYFYGNILNSSIYALADLTNNSLGTWLIETVSTGNIYVTTSIDIISWPYLQAIGKNITDGNTTDDFSDIDTLLQTSIYNDSIYNIYTESGQIKNTENFTIFNKNIPYVPIANSTNNSNFITGILWDTEEDTDGEFSQADKENLIFATKINKNMQGAYGMYDYELRVPAKLRDYNATAAQPAVFYAEIK